ncbi:MAG: hypothetical protein ACREO3_01335 [Arenimonas sp.]
MNLLRSSLFAAGMLAALLTSSASAVAADGGPPPGEKVAPALARELTGTYRFGPGHEVTLAPFDEFGG